MPIDYSKYPSNWHTEIRPRILKRDGNRCKHCQKANYSVGYYDRMDFWHPTAGNIIHDEIGFNGAKTYKEARLIADNNNEWSLIYDEHYIVIVLTIAHLDQDINNNDDSNLAALCQRCHIRHDAHYRTHNKHRKSGQLKLSI